MAVLPTNTMPKSKMPYGHGEYFGGLDGLRGILALVVAIFHTPWGSWINTTPFMDNGRVLLDLFFVFSGFLMYRLYRQKMQTPLEGKKFIWRRFARLYPIHLFMTLIFIAFAAIRLFAHTYGVADHTAGEILPFAAGASESYFTILTNFTLTQSMGLSDTLSFNAPSWTISVEFFAYFTFVALLLFAPPKRGLHFLLIAAAVIEIYMLLAILKPDMNITYDYGFLRCLGGFYTGLLVAHVYGLIVKSRQGKARPSLSLWTGMELFALALYTGFIIYFPGRAQFFVAPVAFIFVLIFAQDLGWISKTISTKPFRYLAKISYSVYMVHFLLALMADIFAAKVLSRVFGQGFHDAHGAGDIYLLTYLVGVIIAGHMLQKYVEAPAATWLGKRRPTRARIKAWVYA